MAARAQFASECERLLVAACDLPVAELPHLLGQLREIEATAMARLVTPQQNGHGDANPEPDSLLDIEQTAERLKVSADYLYRHWKELPFARKYDWGLRFNARGIDEYIRQQPASLYTRPRRGGPVR